MPPQLDLLVKTYHADNQYVQGKGDRRPEGFTYFVFANSAERSEISIEGSNHTNSALMHYSPVADA